jgi:hypothetical protein
MAKARGSTVTNPSTTTYPLSAWIKGYAAWLVVFPIYLFLWGFAITFRRVPNWMLRKLLREWHAYTAHRPPAVLIPAFGPTYMRRWWKIKRNAFFNCYYHLVLRSDEDAALHDHPWWNFSIVLEGGYWEHIIHPGGVHEKTWYPAGSVRFRRSGTFAHRLELATERYANGGIYTGPGSVSTFQDVELSVKTIFITGPVLRRWGFHHPLQWVDAYDWDDFTERHHITTSKMKGYAEQLKGPKQ